MRIATVQGPENPDTPIGCIERLHRSIEAAGRPDLIISPEMYVSGYNIGTEAIRRLAQPANGVWSEEVAAIARHSQTAILYGYPELSDDGQVYNAAQLIGRDGRPLVNHRKSHLFGELDRAAFSAGAGEPTIAELDGVKVGILICYEVEFPENVRLLALGGADLVLVPTALMQPYDFVAQEMVRTRAYENQVFLAYANRCGIEAELTYCGQSCIVAPDGRDLARARGDEAVIAADLDFESMAVSRQLNTYLHDRRPEVYRPLAAGY